MPARSVTASVDVWREELLPEWRERRTDPLMRTRILQGVPSEVQGELWFIGLALPAPLANGSAACGVEVRACEARTAALAGEWRHRPTRVHCCLARRARASPPS